MEDTTYRKSLPADLAAQLNEARLRQGLTIRTGAERCDISRSHFGNLMTGRRAPSVRVALRLVRGLNLDQDTTDALLDHSIDDWYPDRAPAAPRSVARRRWDLSIDGESTGTNG